MLALWPAMVFSLLPAFSLTQYELFDAHEFLNLPYSFLWYSFHLKIFAYAKMTKKCLTVSTRSFILLLFHLNNLSRTGVIKLYAWVYASPDLVCLGKEYVFIVLFCILESESYYIVLTDLKFVTIFLSLRLSVESYRWASPGLAYFAKQLFNCIPQWKWQEIPVSESINKILLDTSTLVCLQIINSYFHSAVTCGWVVQCSLKYCCPCRKKCWPVG